MLCWGFPFSSAGLSSIEIGEDLWVFSSCFTDFNVFSRFAGEHKAQ